MKLNFLITAVLSVGLLSCSDGKSSLDDKSSAHSSRANIAIGSTPKGINLAVTDDHLLQLLNEANRVEEQLSHMAGRLTELRRDIIAYRHHTKTGPSLKQPPMLGDRAVEEATIAPASGDVVTVDRAVEKQTLKPRTVIVTKKGVPVEPEKAEVAKSITEPAKKEDVISNSDGVYKVRYGLHADKTRLVFDLKNGSTQHTMNFDKQAGIVTVTLPEAPWKTASGQTYKLEQLSGYEAKQSGQGTIVAMAVKGTSSVKTMSLSSPNRLVIDLIR